MQQLSARSSLASYGSLLRRSFQAEQTQKSSHEHGVVCRAMLTEVRMGAGVDHKLKQRAEVDRKDNSEDSRFPALL